MSIIYLLCLSAFCVVFLGVMYEAVAAVSRKPVWHRAQMPSLTLVEAIDRRSDDPLPFVGADRRHGDLAAGSQAGDSSGKERTSAAA